MLTPLHFTDIAAFTLGWFRRKQRGFTTDEYYPIQGIPLELA